MDRDEALRLLRGGLIEEWNRRREADEDIPVLIGVDLHGADLHGAILYKVDLHLADLTGANLNSTNLIDADLRRANLVEANLRGADLIRTSLHEANLVEANLGGTNFDGANLHEANFGGANLVGANLSGTNLVGASLFGANLHEANLHEANLYEADLREADLSGAKLVGANLSWANLSGANLATATCQSTIFANVDFSIRVKGLDTIVHLGPSEIGVNTLVLSEGKIPEVFLRGCGVPDAWIKNLPSLIGSMSPNQFHTAFISFSSEDQDFTDRLYTDLRSKGVRCWYAPEHLKIGDVFRTRSGECIHLQDKLLLVLSEHSVKSQWVQMEVETAMAKEREQGRTVLFPIRLDEAVNGIKFGWPADIRLTRHIGDFCKWENREEYRKAFERLLRDLTP